MKTKILKLDPIQSSEIIMKPKVKVIKERAIVLIIAGIEINTIVIIKNIEI